ncbi:hypothetical protein LPJ61_000803 [Coemansia biformis]|uniref:N-acetyltransferase domain-containing protein n=1 Tax=Coemansia biformis TaxID=1286918 RepID=A0A9W7YIX9_9FUNG|nr:hypothetical protein LPJ61_000803 [Coemansia biformis]
MAQLEAAGDLELRNLRSEDEVRAAYPLEVAGYSAEEGASLESMLYRFRQAPHLFLGAFDQLGAIVGYIMSTQVAAPLVTHASMGTHDPDGSTVCIHSVCVSPRWQGKGVASRLLQAYTSSMREYNSRLDSAGSGRRLDRLAMLSRENLLPLYERAGYTTLGRSSQPVGTESWYDCVLDLHTDPGQTAETLV